MALPMLRVLDFRGYEARVVGADVLRALEHVTGTNLRFNLRLLGTNLRFNLRLLEWVE